MIDKIDENILKQWANEYKLREKNKNEQIKKIVADTNYVEWLKNFMMGKDVFFDDAWQYNLEGVKETDLESIKKLCFLYKGVDRFADKNNIDPYPCDFGNFYKVKLDDFAFYIGVLIGQGTVFFCKNVSLENDKDFIDFNDILGNKKTKKLNKRIN